MIVATTFAIHLCFCDSWIFQTCDALGCCLGRRYQMVAGMDRYLFGHSNFLWSYLLATSVVRTASHAVSQQSRLHFMGLPTDAPPEPVQPSPTANELAATRRRSFAHPLLSVIQSCPLQQSLMQFHVQMRSALAIRWVQCTYPCGTQIGVSLPLGDRTLLSLFAGDVSAGNK